MPYQSVGGAATGALLDALAERERSKQQTLQNQRLLMQDQLARDKEAREAQYQRDQIANRQQQLAQDEAKTKAGEERAAQNDFIEHFTKTHIPGDVVTDATTASQVLKVAPDMVQVKQDPAAVGPVQPGQLPIGSAMTVVGNAAQRQAEQQKAEVAQKRQALLDSVKQNGIPSDPAQRLSLELGLKDAGLNISAKDLMPMAGTDVPQDELVYDQDTGTVRRLQVPPGAAPGAKAHWNVQPRTPAPPQAANPQPQVFFDQGGNPHAVQFVGGQSREIPLPDGMVGKTSPITNTVHTRMDFANRLTSHIPDIRAEIQQADKMGVLGPTLGRYNDFLAGKVGSTGDPVKDTLLSKLRTDLSFLKSGMGVVHSGARGAGVEMVKRFDDILSSNKMSKEELLGSLDGFEKWTKSYGAKPETFDETATPTATPSSAAPDYTFDVKTGKLRKGGD